MAISGNLIFCWVRGHLARIFQQDAGETSAYPGISGDCQYGSFKTVNGGFFVFIHLENGQQFGDSKQLLNLLCEIQKF